jgi:citronellol/citronellal dehydrogenase
MALYRDGLLRGHAVLVAPALDARACAVAALFASLGASVAVCAPLADAAAAALPPSLPADRALVHVGDPRRPEAAQAAVAAAWDRFGALDTLVCATAREAAPRAALDTQDDDWREAVGAELDAAWFLMHAAAQRWRDADRAGSVVALVHPFRQAGAGDSLAAATGASIVHLARTVAVEWAAHRVRVNCVAPSGASDRQVAEAAVWLAAPSGKFVTGETMWLARPPGSAG